MRKNLSLQYYIWLYLFTYKLISLMFKHLITFLANLIEFQNKIAYLTTGMLNHLTFFFNF